MLPNPDIEKLPGAVCAQYVKCGKPRCRCANGGKLHGPYWYRFWRDSQGKQHKKYVRKADLERVRAACEAWREEHRQIRGLLAQGELIRRRLSRKRGSVAEDPMAEVMQEIEMYATLNDLARVGSGEFGNPMYQVRSARMFLKLLVGMGEFGSAPKQPKQRKAFRPADLLDLLDRYYVRKD